MAVLEYLERNVIVSYSRESNKSFIAWDRISTLTVTARRFPLKYFQERLIGLQPDHEWDSRAQSTSPRCKSSLDALPHPLSPRRAHSECLSSAFFTVVLSMDYGDAIPAFLAVYL